jgi:hypothetical protein
MIMHNNQGKYESKIYEKCPIEGCEKPEDPEPHFHKHLCGLWGFLWNPGKESGVVPMEHGLL